MAILLPPPPTGNAAERNGVNNCERPVVLVRQELRDGIPRLIWTFRGESLRALTQAMVDSEKKQGKGVTFRDRIKTVLELFRGVPGGRKFQQR